MAAGLRCPECRRFSYEHGLVVYVAAKCPICLLDAYPVVAMQCGHVLCPDHHAEMGGITKKKAPSEVMATDVDSAEWSSAEDTEAEDILEALEILCSDEERDSTLRSNSRSEVQPEHR